MIRILLIEDDPVRIDLFRQWLPCDMRLVEATSAGKAIGILRRDRGRVYSGILLDHDLQDQIITQVDRFMSGSDVIKVIISNASKDIPVLVHSMNITRGPLMAIALKSAGFKYVTRIPMSDLKKEAFLDWIEEVRDLLDEDLLE